MLQFDEFFEVFCKIFARASKNYSSFFITVSLSINVECFTFIYFLFYLSFLAFGNDLKRNTNSQSAWEQSQPSNMAMIKDLQVQCEKDMMRVRILFDRPFYGMVFSKGHYSNVNCVHVPSGLGQTSVSTTYIKGHLIVVFCEIMN